MAGLSFALQAREEGGSLEAELPGYRNRATIELDADGALERYRHDVGSHRMVISLKEAVPLIGTEPPTASRFSLLLDPDAPVAGGRVVSEPVAGGRRLLWTIDTPSWASAYPFESVIEQRDGRMALTIRSARQAD